MSDETLILDAVDRFLAKDVAPFAHDLEQADAYPHEIVERMKTLGLFGATIGERYGGMGLPASVYAKIVERVSAVWMSVSGIFNSHLIMCNAIERFGTEPLKEAFLPRLARGELRGGIALTEPDCGTDLQAIRTRAVRDGDEYVVTGTKQWITNSVEGNVLAVLVKTDPDVTPRHRGMSLLVVPKDAGYRATKLKKLGYRGVDTGEVEFPDVRVPAANLVGEAEGRGLQQILSGLALGRINVAARGVGVAQASLDAALSYARQRKTFGQPISEHQAIQIKLADMAVRVESARLLTGRAAGIFDTGERCDLEAGMAKLAATEAAVENSMEAMRIHGAYGYSPDNDVERYYRDAPLLAIGEGTNEMQRIIIARQLVERRPRMSEPAPAATPGPSPPGAERREAPGFWNTVRMLGRLLGRVIEADRGHDFLERIETIRALAKAARSRGAWFDLYRYLEDIPSYEVMDVTRAFNQFLNLANIAEQDHQVRNLEEDARTAWANLFDRLSAEEVAAALRTLRIESVLTPHPTEILRRTLVLKYDAIAAELKGPRPSERRLERLIAEAWHTDDIRNERTSPQDEAKWGFAVVENSLWDALPACLRDIDDALARRNLPPLPIDVAPVRIASWMGGDRQGNPNVTAAVTREVLMLARWMAADLYLRDVEALQADLSMKECNGALRNRVGDDPEPYRALLKTVRERLSKTRDWAERLHPMPIEGIYFTDRELLEPLELCHRSLRESGMAVIADGPLRDTLRRVHAFGVTLVSLDIRQSAARHTAVLDEITEYLDIGPSGSYAHWTEPERLAFLQGELGNRRPLFPAAWPATPESREVLDTCGVIAELDGAGISHYIVSEAQSPTDVLAAVLLLQETGVTAKLPITPQFETLSDLDRVAGAVDEVLSIPWYHDYANGEQRVLIGYEDSAKNAGQLASAWRQFQAKEQLTEVTRRHGVRLVLFHGRGGAVGRGRETARAAIRSQPPGCIAGRLRVTEPGEAIRFKLGDSALARDTLMRYLIGVIEAQLDPPAAPTADQRKAMDDLAQRAFGGYRALVADTPGFVDYFREITPEEELTASTGGGRPENRHAAPDISGLSAVSWVFAWTQARLILPAWLGTDAALHALRRNGTDGAFDAMMRWPFFSMQMHTLEAMLARTDIELADFYANRLTPKAHRDVHEIVRERLAAVKNDLLALTGASELLGNQPLARDSMDIRDTYLDPLHLLQAELLARLRETDDEHVAQALRATMAGIASGLRYTG